MGDWWVDATWRVVHALLSERPLSFGHVFGLQKSAEPSGVWRDQTCLHLDSWLLILRRSSRSSERTGWLPGFTCKKCLNTLYILRMPDTVLQLWWEGASAVSRRHRGIHIRGNSVKGFTMQKMFKTFFTKEFTSSTLQTCFFYVKKALPAVAVAEKSPKTGVTGQPLRLWFGGRFLPFGRDKEAHFSRKSRRTCHGTHGVEAC